MSSNINTAARQNGHLNGEAGAQLAASAKEAILEPAPGMAAKKRTRLPKARNPEVVPPPEVSGPERGTEQPLEDNGQQEGISPKSLAEVIEAAARMPAIERAEWAADKKEHAKPFGITGTELIEHVKARCREIAAEEKASKSQRRSRPQGPGAIDWPEITDKGVKGRSQENIEAFLEHAGVTLKFDAMAHRTIVTRAGQSVTLTDEVAKGLWYESDRLGLPSKDTYFFGFLENKAREASFHPIRDYLAALEWDGVPRLDEWLHAYFDAENTPLNSAYGRKHLIAAVRRVRQPGCKHDAMLVLQGPQGAGKSSSIKALCRFFAAGVVAGDHHQVAQGSRGSHEGPLFPVPVAAAAEDGDDPGEVQLLQGPQGLGQGGRGMGVVHEDAGAARGAETLQPARHPFQGGDAPGHFLGG